MLARQQKHARSAARYGYFWSGKASCSLYSIHTAHVGVLGHTQRLGAAAHTAGATWLGTVVVMRGDEACCLFVGLGRISIWRLGVLLGVCGLGVVGVRGFTLWRCLMQAGARGVVAILCILQMAGQFEPQIRGQAAAHKQTCCSSSLLLLAGLAEGTSAWGCPTTSPVPSSLCWLTMVNLHRCCAHQHVYRCMHSTCHSAPWPYSASTHMCWHLVREWLAACIDLGQAAVRRLHCMPMCACVQW